MIFQKPVPDFLKTPMISPDKQVKALTATDEE